MTLYFSPEHYAVFEPALIANGASRSRRGRGLTNKEEAINSIIRNAQQSAWIEPGHDAIPDLYLRHDWGHSFHATHKGHRNGDQCPEIRSFTWGLIGMRLWKRKAAAGFSDWKSGIHVPESRQRDHQDTRETPATSQRHPRVPEAAGGILADAAGTFQAVRQPALTQETDVLHHATQN